jgi:hypothetical protein
MGCALAAFRELRAQAWTRLALAKIPRLARMVEMMPTAKQNSASNLHRSEAWERATTRG